MWGNPTLDGLDTAIRVASWNITGTEYTLLDGLTCLFG